MADDRSQISERLRAARRSAGATQGEVAAAIGVDPQTVARWERGERQPSAKFFEAAMLYLAGLLPGQSNLNRLVVSESRSRTVYPYAAPPGVHDAILSFERDAARAGASDRELDLISEILRSKAVAAFARVDDHGNTVDPERQTLAINGLIDAFRYWLSRQVPTVAEQRGRGARIEPEPIPAPRGKSHAEAVADLENAHEKKPKRA